MRKTQQWLEKPQGTIDIKSKQMKGKKAIQLVTKSQSHSQVSKSHIKQKSKVQATKQNRYMYIQNNERCDSLIRTNIILIQTNII